MEASTLEITPELNAYGGEAMGRLPDGRAVFVPFALPGERVRIRLVEEKRGFARAELVEVLQPAEHRIQPRCAHYTICGGCHYQHLAYADQLKIKQDILRDQLIRIGKLIDPPVSAVVACPEPFNYRNHVQFHLDAAGRLGYMPGYMPAGAGEVVAIQECHLLAAELDQVWRLLEFDAMPDLERVGLRLGSDGEIQLILESRQPLPPEISIEDLSISIVHLHQDDSVVLAGSQSLTMEVLGKPFQVSAGSFFQVNMRMAEALVEGLLAGIRERTTLSADTVLLDAYCGVGLFSAFLAPQVGRLIGIEASASAVEDFAVNLDEFDHIEIYQAPAELVLPSLEMTPAQVVVIDPPRSGVDRRALDAILALSPQVLAYISCDPATLARDARRLQEGGYRLQQVTPYDLFPQTYHIESLSFWMPA